MMANLRCAILGAGPPAARQIQAWQEVGGVAIAACWDSVRSRADAAAARFGIPKVYADVEELFQNEKLDFVAVIAEASAQPPLVELAAAHKAAITCRAPFAPDFATARRMVERCRAAGVLFHVQENYRWLETVRYLKRLVDEGRIGRLVRGRFTFAHFLEQAAIVEQPQSAGLDNLILADQGSHQFDLARFFFGEFATIYAQTLRVRAEVAGEDVASALLTQPGALVHCEFSFSTRTEPDRFPHQVIYLEGAQGTLALNADHWISITTAQDALSARHPPLTGGPIPPRIL